MSDNWKVIADAVKYEISPEGIVRNRATGKVLKQFVIANTPTIKMQDAGKAICRSVPKLVEKAFGSRAA